MPSKQEPDKEPADVERESERSEILTLVDLFDRMDRAAFERTLDIRKIAPHPDTRR